MTRIALAVGLVAFGTVVFVGVQERAEPAAARVIDRADPEAMIENTVCHHVQTVGPQENFTLDAAKCLTYEDRAVRFLDGVTMQVTAQTDRDSFVVTGTEASVNGEQTSVIFSGDVRLDVSDGLSVQTDTATYSTDTRLVTMHRDTGVTTLTRNGMHASGRVVVHDGDRAVVDLDDAARVILTGDQDRSAVEILSPHAILANADRYMRFDGGTEVLTGPMVLEAEHSTAHFGEEETALERLELSGSARIRATDPASGGLREMRADDMTLAFEETARVLEQVMLAGKARIELVGSSGERGAIIDATTMNVTMAPDGRDVTALEAADRVLLELPETADGARQDIGAAKLLAPVTPDTGLTSVRFDEGVVFRELRTATGTSAAVTRVIQAERLEAGVEDGLSVLLEARFLGGVRFDDDTRVADADEAVYDVTGGIVTLGTGGDAGRAPILTDATTLIEAATIVLAVDGSTIEALNGVKSVLTPGGDESTGVDAVTTPGLLTDDEQIFVNAEELRYDGEAKLATYTGQAHLWQGNTSFEGDTLAVDDKTGNLTATGDVRTTIQLMRRNEMTQGSEMSRTRAEGDTFTFDHVARHARYATNALLRSDDWGLTLKADAIDVFLETDDRTLDRLEATGAVSLLLDGRWATGEHLVYFEADGRYVMEGAPVEIVEEIEPEEPTTTVPPQTGTTVPALTCRSTRGRVLTFFRSTETVIVDGREEQRTESESGTCSPPTF